MYYCMHEGKTMQVRLDHRFLQMLRSDWLNGYLNEIIYPYMGMIIYPYKVLICMYPYNHGNDGAAPMI